MTKFKRLGQVAEKATKYWRFSLFVITMLMFLFLPERAIFAFYTKGLYSLLRNVLDFLSKIIAIPFLYVLIAGLLVLIVRKLYLLFKASTSFSQKLINLLGSVLGSIMNIIILFYWLWGFNYGSVSLMSYNGVEAEPVSFDFVEEEYFRVLDTLNVLSTEVGNPSWSSINKDTLRSSLAEFLEIYYVNNELQPVVHNIQPKGFLMRLGAQGIYLPWAGQGQIDDGLHELQKPFTYLHEMGHGFGITNEGECNFLAYKVGITSNDIYVKYSAYLSYWRYLARQMLMIGCHDKSLMSDELRKDLQAIYENYDKYPDFFPKFRRRSYDLYLKAQGVEEGMKSYSEIIMMNYCWNNKFN